MAEVWVSNLLLLILYLSCCEQPDSSKAMLSWLCVPIWTRLWLLTIKYIFRSAFHLSEKDWMHIYEPPATKSWKEESIEYIRCLYIHLPYACHFKPRLVYFVLHFWKPIPCFQGCFFQKILSLCMVRIQEQFVFVIKSRLWCRVYDLGEWHMPLPPQVFGGSWLTLYQPGGHIMPTTLLHAPLDFQTCNSHALMPEGHESSPVAVEVHYLLPLTELH